MRLLVTGGAGYIGAHTVRELLAAGHEVLVFDNLLQGHRAAVPVEVVQGDLLDRKLVGQLFKEHTFDAVVHFAAYAIVGESIRDPAKYFGGNVVGAVNLLDAMMDSGTRQLVFSSTSEVYGEARELPIAEDHPKVPTNPYGESKWMIEQMIRRYSDAYGLRSIALRYFNAAGAADDGSLGESHLPETHLIPNAIQAALGRGTFELTCPKVDTPDGTTVRDYVHVVDLARAHVLALQALIDGHATGAYNVGLGRGYSTGEVVETVQRITGVEFPVTQADPRPGEPPAKYAANASITAKLGWKATHDLESIVRTALLWHRTHPDGFGPPG